MRLISAQTLLDPKGKGIPFSKPTLWRMIKAGDFPRPIKCGALINAWLEEEVDAWIQARLAMRLAPPETQNETDALGEQRAGDPTVPRDPAQQDDGNGVERPDDIRRRGRGRKRA